MTESRFSDVSRRAVLQGLSAAALLGLVGCANDSPVLPGAEQSSPGAPQPATSSATAAGSATISFTYTADSAGGGGRGGMVRNPYIAVWVENSAGALVKTIALWHLQNGQDRWLNELYQWYEASGGVDTTSSATRVAGSYTLSWDLTDTHGTAVPSGSYTVWVEAIREHGPYSVTSGEVSLIRSSKQSAATKIALQSNGELSAIQFDYQP